MDLTPEQEEEAKMARSKAIWKAFAKQVNQTSVNDRKKEILARNARISAERAKQEAEKRNGRRTPGRPADR